MSVRQQDIASHPDFDQHEQVVVADGPELQAIVAVHNSRLGPAAGGCRIFPYPDHEQALGDVLRLSRGMTYKSALAGLPLGGGKSVIIANPATDKSRAMLLAMGEFIDSFGGRYVAAEDSGTTVADIAVMQERTAHISGCAVGEQFGGDPSPVTARGIFAGIQEAVRFQRDADLKGLRVAIQGVGNVGHHLAQLLTAAGAEVVVADCDAARVRQVCRALGAMSMPVEDILAAEVDVLAPCAMGGAINEASVTAIRASIVAGGANNQLASPALGEELRQREILYAPDYVINAGGIIDIYYQRQGVRDRALIDAHVGQIAKNLATIFRQAELQRRPTSDVADDMAREIFMKPTHQGAAA